MPSSSSRELFQELQYFDEATRWGWDEFLYFQLDHVRLGVVSTLLVLEKRATDFHFEEETSSIRTCPQRFMMSLFFRLILSPVVIVVRDADEHEHVSRAKDRMEAAVSDSDLFSKVR